MSYAGTHKEQRLMTVLSNSLIGEEGFAMAESTISSRKVARSGHISYQGQSYYISKCLAGRYIRLVESSGRLIVDAAIPVHKEYALINK
jgi:hypothetical protein